MHSFSSSSSRNRIVKRIIPTLGVVTVALMLAACAGRGTPTTTATANANAKFTTVTIVTPATESDHGWNQMGLKGARAAAAAVGLKLTEDPNVGYDNTETILTQAAQKDGVGLVIAHASGFAQAADHANQTTGVPVLITDFPTQQIKGHIGVITFSAQQGGYLAGITAAMSSKSNKVGIAVSADDINWYTMAGGFVAGARSVNPTIQISVAYIGAAAYDDSAGGKKVVQQLIASGDDVIFGMGDGATIGYVAAVDEANQAGTSVKYIADIGDVSDLVKNPDEVLTSVLWKFDGAYQQAIKDVIAGTFAQAPYDLNLKNGGITLEDTTTLTSAMKDAVKTATSGIEGGSITVPNTTTKDLLTALLNK
jgi:basic membrane protein A